MKPHPSLPGAGALVAVCIAITVFAIGQRLLSACGWWGLMIPAILFTLSLFGRDLWNHFAARRAEQRRAAQLLLECRPRARDHTRRRVLFRRLQDRSAPNGKPKPTPKQKL